MKLPAVKVLLVLQVRGRPVDGRERLVKPHLKVRDLFLFNLVLGLHPGRRGILFLEVCASFFEFTFKLADPGLLLFNTGAARLQLFLESEDVGFQLVFPAAQLL